MSRLHLEVFLEEITGHKCLSEVWDQRAEQHGIYLRVPQRPFAWLIHQVLFQQGKILKEKP